VRGRLQRQDPRRLRSQEQLHEALRGVHERALAALAQVVAVRLQRQRQRAQARQRRVQPAQAAPSVPARARAAGWTPAGAG